MRTVFMTDMRRALLLSGCLIGAWGLVTAGTARGQTPVPDAGPGGITAATGQASQGGGLDMDVDPSSSVVTAPTSSRDRVQDTLSTGAGESAEHLAPSTATVPPATAPVATAPSLPAPPAPAPSATAPSDGGEAPAIVTAQPTVSEPVSLDHPTVVDTATFESGGTTVALYGIEGVKGEMAEGMQGFLTAHGNRVTCQAQSSVDFVCLQPDGTDVAEVALVNGAARAKPDAPGPYRDQEAAAQTARRGIWANLPPPPATVKHPMVIDTATLAADGQTYVLDGLIGLGAPFAGQMQMYIAQHGDGVVCDPQSLPGHYVCLLGDNTDIAKVALVNGAARVAPDAPDAYRVQQAEALNNHRGFWVNQSQEMIMASTVVATAPPCCALVPGDDGVDGIAYVAGVPTAVIDGETVFFTYGGDAGWGYYDHWHHWRDVPGHYRAHLEHFHPYGHGLRGYGYDHGHGYEAAVHREEAMHREEAFHPGGAHPGMEPGMHTAMAHPGMAAPGMHSAMAAPGMHPGMAAPAHPFGAGSGFVHPGPSAAGFHPGGAAMPHAAPAVHASSGGGGGGKHK